MDEIVNPHDKFFKEVFSHKDAATDLLSNYLPEPLLKLIDLEKLDIVKDSFIEKELKEFYSDLLYKISLAENPAYLYILFEHKSYPYKLTALQLLEYMTKIRRLHLNQNPKQKLPVIIPFVVYHGVETWSYGTRFSDLLHVPDKALVEYVPDFSFIFHDLSGYSDEQIKGIVVSRVGLLVMKHIFSDTLPEILRHVMKLLTALSNRQRALDYVATIIRYVLNASEAVDLDTMKGIIEQSNFHEEEGNLMTIAEKLRMEGRQEGLHDAEESVVDVLEARFAFVPQNVIEKVKGIGEIALLKQLHKKAVVVEGIEQFEEALRSV